MLRTLALLLPAVIPSWRFFDEITASPRVEYVLLNGTGDTSENWLEFRPKPPNVSMLQMAGRMFWNRERNEDLFLVSLSERMMGDASECTYQEICHRLRTDLTPVPQTHFKFRLMFVHRGEGRELLREELFVSEAELLSAEGVV